MGGRRGRPHRADLVTKRAAPRRAQMSLTLPPRLRRKGGPAVRDAVRAFTEKQKETGFVGSTIVDTMRVCLPKQVDFEKLVFAAGELLQNQGDASKDALAAGAALVGKSHAPVRQVENGLEWMLGDAVAMGVYFTERGVELFQHGRPICIDACASGTQSKQGGEGKTGGYGDGMKTGANDITAFGYGLQFSFRGYDEEHSRRAMRWRWLAEVPENFRETHLVVRIEEEDRPADEPGPPAGEFDADVPTMVTEIAASDPEMVATLHEAFAAALRRFQWLLYEETEDPEGRTVAKEGWGSWRHACTFSPVVNYINSHDQAYSLGREPTRMRFLVGGVFYEARSLAAGMPPTLVVEVPGRGIIDKPPEEHKVFRNQLRDLDDSLASDFVVQQVAAFMADEALEERVTAAFLPLLEGGSSLLLESSNGGNLTCHLINNFHSKLRPMLLYRKLLPENATEKQREETRRVCRTAICASKQHCQQVKYLKKIIDDGLVVVVDSRKVNTHLFYVNFPSALQNGAADAALRKAKDGVRGFAGSDSSLEPAIDYVSDGSVVAVRVSFEKGDYEPYHFRSGNVIVYYSRLADTPRTVSEIFPPLFRDTEDEARRCFAFSLHFQSNEVRDYSFGKRVKKAVEAAKSGKDFNIGKKKKRKSGDSSDSSDEEEKRPSKKPKVQNQPQPAAPPAALRSAGMGTRQPATHSGGAPDLLPQKFLSQVWSDKVGMYYAQGEKEPEPSAKKKIRLRVFNEALEEVRDSQDVGNCVVYASWSPGADWGGLHFASSGLCLVNLAPSKQTKAERAVTILHELSHAKSTAHDVVFVDELQRRVGLLLAYLRS